MLGLAAVVSAVSCGGRSSEDGGVAKGGASAGGAAQVGGTGLAGQTHSSGASHSGGQASSGGSDTSGGHPANGGQGATGARASGGERAAGGQSDGGGAAGAQEDCGELVSEFQSVVDEAKVCNPAFSAEQCVMSVPSDLRCGCPTFVNPKNAAALEKLEQLVAAYNRCSDEIFCGGACLEPTSGHCSPEGVCTDRIPGKGRSCKVAGVIYPDGTGGFQHPDSPCNTCACNDGALTCTKAACPPSCPDGTAFGQQCAECGPADGCILPEYDCFTKCSSSEPCDDKALSCLNGLCLSGFCR